MNGIDYIPNHIREANCIVSFKRMYKFNYGLLEYLYIFCIYKKDLQDGQDI